MINSYYDKTFKWCFEQIKSNIYTYFKVSTTLKYALENCRNSVFCIKMFQSCCISSITTVRFYQQVDADGKEQMLLHIFKTFHHLLKAPFMLKSAFVLFPRPSLWMYLSERHHQLILIYMIVQVWWNVHFFLLIFFSWMLDFIYFKCESHPSADRSSRMVQIWKKK